MKKIIIFGSGECGKEILEVVLNDINRDSPCWELIGFIDSDLSKAGGSVSGYPVLGDRYNGDSTEIYGICAIMDNKIRERVIQNEIIGNGFQLTSLIHPRTVKVNDFVHDKGVVVYPGTKISYNVRLGKGSIVNYNCVLGHDLSIGDFTYFGPTVTIAGCCQVGRSCTIGAGANLLQGVSVGDRTTVGIGTTLIKSVGGNKQVIDIPRSITTKKR
jgi:sugar O-acyltransferase (sialic acid O-acetyltransferase NeuD family)|tara:strand:+ start:4382 stop:5026 length:645 start_codon:yes stop_codon:yes gene_type:complete